MGRAVSVRHGSGALDLPGAAASRRLRVGQPIQPSPAPLARGSVDSIVEISCCPSAGPRGPYDNDLDSSSPANRDISSITSRSRRGGTIVVAGQKCGFGSAVSLRPRRYREPNHANIVTPDTDLSPSWPWSGSDPHAVVTCATTTCTPRRPPHLESARLLPIIRPNTKCRTVIHR